MPCAVSADRARSSSERCVSRIFIDAATTEMRPGLEIDRGAVGWLPEAQLLDETLKTLAVFGAVDGIGTRADDGYAIRLQVARKL